MESGIEQRRLDEIKKILVVITSKMSVPLYLAFLITDYLYVPQFFVIFAVMRICIIGLTLYIRSQTQKLKTLGDAQATALALVLTNSIPITIMIWLIGDVSTPYYAGLNLVAIAGISFIPWTRNYLFLVIGLIYTPFLMMVPFLDLKATNFVEFL